MGSSLLESFTEIRGGADPVTAYQRLSVGPHKIKFFGPAFFTKWLYFAGYEASSKDVRRPLILDSRVAASLGWASWGWTSSDYARYLDLAHEAALMLHTTPHVIEHALFTINRNVSVEEKPASPGQLTIRDVNRDVPSALEA